MERFVICFLLFCGFFPYGIPIMCYECNSATNSFCLEKKLPDSLRRNCSEHDRGVGQVHTLCRKIVQHFDYGVNGQVPQSRVIRACGWDESKYKNSCYHRAGYGGRQEVCSCTTNYCNRGDHVLAPSVLLVSTFIVFIGSFIR